jgi:CheY-like chemotaxis protein
MGTTTIWLIVEDDLNIRMMLSAMMTLWDVTPLAFRDGHEAMNWLDQVEAGTVKKDQIPQLALLDIRMPGPQGYDIAYRLRNLPQTAGMPIVMMTAYRLSPEERVFIETKAYPELFIPKPLPAPDDLRVILQELIPQ